MVRLCRRIVDAVGFDLTLWDALGCLLDSVVARARWRCF